MIVLQAKSPNSLSIILFISIFRHQPHLIFSFSNYTISRKKLRRLEGVFCINFVCESDIKYNKYMLNCSVPTFLWYFGCTPVPVPMRIFVVMSVVPSSVHPSPLMIGQEFTSNQSCPNQNLFLEFRIGI